MEKDNIGNQEERTNNDKITKCRVITKRDCSKYVLGTSKRNLTIWEMS